MKMMNEVKNKISGNEKESLNKVINPDQVSSDSEKDENNNSYHIPLGTEQFRDQFKKNSVVMSDSETIISPAVSMPKSLPETSNAANNAAKMSIQEKRNLNLASDELFSNFKTNNQQNSSYFRSHRHLMIVFLLGFLLASIILGTVIINRNQMQEISRENEPFVNELPKLPDPVDVSGNNYQLDQKPLTNNLPVKEQKVNDATRRKVTGEEINAEKKLVNANEKPDVESLEYNDSARKISNSEAQSELNDSLNDWVRATNARNLDGQMVHYAPKLKSYYLERDASSNSVRQEKRRVFGNTDSVDIQTDKPKISLSPDGRTATMRFRKKYLIRKGQDSRNGEVIQEMKWIKSAQGWKIIGERDLKVINH